MKQGDLVVGEEYAFREREEWRNLEGAARVKVVGKPAGGQVDVRFLEKASDSKLPKPKGTTTIKTRYLLCPWPEWPAFQKAEAQARLETEAERETWNAAYEYARTSDPQRPLPDIYEETLFEYRYEESVHVAQILAALNERRVSEVSEEQVVPVLQKFDNEGVIRDFTAAVVEDNRFQIVNADESAAQPTSVTVNVAYRGAAHLLAKLVRRRGVSLREVFEDRDLEFIEACRQQVLAAGGDLELPPTPSLPGEDMGWRSESPPWFRVFYATNTSGRRLHDPNCSALGSHSDPYAHVANVAAWTLRWADVCGRCWGPGVRVSPALVAFRAAADVWALRNPASNEPEDVAPEENSNVISLHPTTPPPAIEAWQVRATVLLIAQAEMDRAELGEPRRTLTHATWDALAPLEPGQGEAMATALLVHDRDAKGNEGPMRVRAVRRVLELVEMLPEDLRKKVPDEVQRIASGSTIGASHVIHYWFRSQMHAVRDVLYAPEVLLFGEHAGYIWPEWSI